MHGRDADTRCCRGHNDKDGEFQAGGLVTQAEVRGNSMRERACGQMAQVDDSVATKGEKQMAQWRQRAVWQGERERRWEMEKCWCYMAYLKSAFVV
jgi:hypothetical protein